MSKSTATKSKRGRVPTARPAEAPRRDALARVPASPPLSALAIEKPWFVGLPSWRRTGKHELEEYRHFTEAGRVALDRDREHRETIARGLMDQIFATVDAIKGLKLDEDGISSDPYGAFVALMVNVRHALRSNDVSFVAKHAALTAARASMFQVLAAAQEIQAAADFGKGAP